MFMFQGGMARAYRGALDRQSHAILGAAPGFRFSSSVHTEHAARLGRRRNRSTDRIQLVLASRRGDLQVRVRKTNRPRRPFTLRSPI